MIQVGKIVPICVNFARRVSRSNSVQRINNVNSKPEMAHWTKAPGKPFKVCEWIKNQKSRNSKQKPILYHPNLINGVQ